MKSRQGAFSQSRLAVKVVATTNGQVNGRPNYMPDIDEISEFQSFTERTLKYGRNLMAASVPIIVFAWVPAVNLSNSRPLNFEIEKGGEIWIWVILLALLIYYGFRFFGLAVPDYFFWQRQKGTYKSQLDASLSSQVGKEKS